MTNPVFCSECRHFSSAADHDDTDSCRIKDPDSASWKRANEHNFYPYKQNKNNDCKHWAHRRSFSEWIHDLVTGND